MPVYCLHGLHRLRVSLPRLRRYRKRKAWQEWFGHFIFHKRNFYKRYRGAPLRLLDEKRWGYGYWYK